MSEKVKRKIFEIFTPENLYFFTKVLGVVILTIWGNWLLQAPSLKNDPYVTSLVTGSKIY